MSTLSDWERRLPSRRAELGDLEVAAPSARANVPLTLNTVRGSEPWFDGRWT